MNTNALLLAVVLWLVCVFAALVFFISRVNSVRKDTKEAIDQVNERSNERHDSFADSYSNLIFNLTKRVQKLEETIGTLCVKDAGTDEEGKTSLYAITKVGYSTIMVALTEDELAVIDSFIDWADLEEEFSAVKIDVAHYTAVDWRNKK